MKTKAWQLAYFRITLRAQLPNAQLPQSDFFQGQVEDTKLRTAPECPGSWWLQQGFAGDRGLDTSGDRSHFFVCSFFFCQTQSCLVLPDPELRTAITIHEALTTAGGVDFPDSSGKWWQPSPLPASEKALPCLNLLWETVVFCRRESLFCIPR